MTEPDEFFGQFIDDYFAECDEHLATARRVLLTLEESGAREPDAALLRELHRSLHTLKGLAGMVGDSCAERVAHGVEDALRNVIEASLPFAGKPVDTLFSGVDAIEACSAARRAGTPSPDVTGILADLARTLPSAARDASAPGPRTTGSTPVAREAALGETIYHFEFAPSLELTDRGVSVEAVRTRLRELGSLLDAKPRMDAGGLTFDFWISVSSGRAPDDAWRADGMRWTAAVPVEREAESVDAPTSVAVPQSQGATSLVRVDLSRLDDVMRLVGDLVVSRSRFEDILRQLPPSESSAARDALEETNAQMERQIRRLREGIMRIRLVRVSEVFDRLRFAARDAIRESGKRVNLVFHGQSTEIDKQIVDRMLEPLLHVVRNAVIHGVESPAEREAAGKPAEGTLTLSASTAGDRIVIQVEDDGRGIDVERVAARAREAGMLAAHETFSDDRLLDFLCAPGLSTREEADLTSGRGVGMDVVRSSVRALAGELSLDSSPGHGTRFTIELPLTLMIVDALLVEVAGQHMAVPQPVLREILQIDTADIIRFENNDVVPYRGGVLPIVRIAELFSMNETPRSNVYLLVVGTDAAPMGFLVDRLLELREIVVHPVTDPLVAMAGVGGATELGDGRVSLILDTAALLRLAQEQREQSKRARNSQKTSARARSARLPHLTS